MLRICTQGSGGVGGGVDLETASGIMLNPLRTACGRTLPQLVCFVSAIVCTYAAVGGTRVAVHSHSSCEHRPCVLLVFVWIVNL